MAARNTQNEPNALARLEAMKAQIETAKTNKARLEGERKSTVNRMQEKYRVSTLEAARKKLAGLGEEEARLTKELDKDQADLEANYDWGG